jgi:hypothetical protein
MNPARFTKGDTIVPAEAIYPSGAMTVDGYEPDGTLLAHPLGGGLQYRFKPGIQRKFRVVPNTEAASPSWRRGRFEIEGLDAEFRGWTNGRLWNGWAMPYFERSEAQQVLEALTDSEGGYDVERDCFVSASTDGEEDIWPAESITVLGGQRLKVYGIGAGAWIWEENANA